MASPIFQFNAEGIMAAQTSIATMAGQCRDLGDNLKAVAVDPVENGIWIGEGSVAYLEQMALLLTDNQQMAVLLDRFQQELGAFAQETSDFIYAQRLVADKGAEVKSDSDAVTWTIGG
ncbi:MAG: hypothetical protein HY866_21855 [Chloroflexi bacterium]|nr:hypothetical protein [Chloroflexota bacterium]